MHIEVELLTEGKYFELSIPVSVVESGEVEFGKRCVQEEMRKVSSIVTFNEHYEKHHLLSWINTFSQQAVHFNKNINGSNIAPELL